MKRKNKNTKSEDNLQDVIDIMENANKITQMSVKKIQEELQSAIKHQRITINAAKDTADTMKHFADELKVLKNKLLSDPAQTEVYDGADLTLI